MTEKANPQQSRKHKFRRELVNTTWENVVSSDPLSEIKRAATTDTRRVKSLLRSIGSNLTDETNGLLPEERTHFITELSTKYKEHVDGERKNNLFLGRLLKNGAIPLACVNPDGTFNVEKLQTEDYFQENPHMVEVLDLRNRQLSEKSKIRQKVSRQVLIHNQEDENFADIEPEIPDAHGEHDHHHHANEQVEIKKSRPVISRKWQAATIAGNALIGAAELLTGGGSTLSVTADGIHNAGDAGTYYLQTENILNPNSSEKKAARRRKIAHAIIAGLSLGAASKAGHDLYTGEEAIQDPMTIYSASASLALNSLLMATLYRGINRKKQEGTIGPHEKDLTKHLWAIDVPSATIAVGGTVAQKYGIHDIESIGAVASGLVGAYAFRPTKENLGHGNCAKHGSHAEHGHVHVHSHDMSKEEKVSVVKKTRSKWKPVATGAAASVAAVALSGSLGAGAQKVSEEPERFNQPASTHTLQVVPSPETPLFTLPAIQETKAAPDDTQWGIAKKAIGETGLQPSNALTNPIVDYMAYENREVVSNPDKISVGETIAVPSEEVIKSFSAAMNTPREVLSIAEQQFANDIQELNTSAQMSKEEKIKKKEPVLKRIKNYLKSKLSMGRG